MKVKNILKPNYTEDNWRKPLPLTSNPIILEDIQLENAHDQPQKHLPGKEGREGDPIIRKRHNAHPMELFFDLFFVANLGSFGSVHEITTEDSVKTYVGYISILWFYWLQTALFDTRFYSDSVMERLLKAVHLGVMTAFAVVAPNFNLGESKSHPGRFRNVSFILMASRLILALQYAVVAFYIRGHKKKSFGTKMKTTTGMLFFSSLVFLIVGILYQYRVAPKAYIAWFIIPGFEALILVSVSLGVLSFKGTSIVERFGGLTLICLGEGVVGMTKAVTSIAKGTARPSVLSIAMISCYVLLLYLTFMIYFDQSDEKRFGSIRQQIWALLHYPLSIAILFTNEASRAFVLYVVAQAVYLNAVQQAVPLETETGPVIAENLRAVFDQLSERLSDQSKFPRLEPIYQNMTSLSNSTIADEKLFQLYLDWLTAMYNWLMSSFGVDLTKDNGINPLNAQERLLKTAERYFTVFRFFFIAAGLGLISMGLLHWFSKSHKSRGEVISIIITCIMGLSVSLVSIMTEVNTDADLNRISAFIDSGWVLPSVVLAYAFVVLVDNVIIFVSHKRRTKYFSQVYTPVP